MNRLLTVFNRFFSSRKNNPQIIQQKNKRIYKMVKTKSGLRRKLYFLRSRGGYGQHKHILHKHHFGNFSPCGRIRF